MRLSALRALIATVVVLIVSNLTSPQIRAQTPSDQPGQTNPDAPQQSPDTPAPVRPQNAPIYAPGYPGYPVDIGGDRPRVTPPSLLPNAVTADSGVEVGVGAPLVSIQSHKLHFSQGPQPFLSDGALLSVDIVLNQWRFEYAKLLVRRSLDSSTTYQSASVNFIGIDADQLWAFYGWWPVYNLYIAGGLGAEYRLTRLSNSTTTPGTATTTNSPQTVKAFTDTVGVWGVLVNWAVAPPVTLKFRAFQEEGGGVVAISGTAFQIGFIVPF